MKRLLAGVVVGCCAVAAHADGGRLQMRQAAGPFVVSLFTTPESLAVGPADVSVLVEEQGSVLLAADVIVTLTPEDASIAPVVAHLSHARATNRLMEDAVVQLPRAGRWRAVVHVSDAGREASAATDLKVADHSARRGTILLFAVLPLCAIALFAWVQTEKRRAWRARMLRPA